MSRVSQNLWQKFSNGPREKQALAFLRIATGLFFLYVGYQKLENPDFPMLMVENLKKWSDGSPYLIYQAFVQTVILPNSLFFAKLITFGEIGIGVSYILGAWVRFSGPAALFLNLNFLLATQHTGMASIGINLAFMIIHLSLFWSRAGHCFGLDTLIPSEHKRLGPPPKRVATKSVKTVARSRQQAKADAEPTSAGNNRRMKSVKASLERQVNAHHEQIQHDAERKPGKPQKPAKAMPEAIKTPEETPAKAPYRGIIDLRD